MVDALTEVHRLLRPGGVLVDIHPVPGRMLYEVRWDGKVLFSAPDPRDFFEELRSADTSLDEVVRRKLFTREGARRFDFFVEATSVSELVAFLQEANAFDEEEDEPSEEEVQLEARLREAMRSAGAGARVLTRERGRATKLGRIP